MTREIPISKIDYGTNVRTERDEDIRDLARSIERNDVLQPLVVRPRGGRYEVVCGHRRYKALKLVGGDIHVPCIVRDDMDDGDVLRVQLEENVHRKQMSAFELVAAFDDMKARSGGRLTNRRIAQMLGKSENWVSGQYFAVRQIDKLYSGAEADAAKKYTSGKIYGDWQHKSREENALHGNGFDATRRGRVVTLRCDDAAKAEEIMRKIADCGKEANK